MDRDPLRLDSADLHRLRDAVRTAQVAHESLPRADILAVHDAAPKDAGLTVDFEATEQLGMPLLVVRVPIGPRPSPVLACLTPREFEVAGLVAVGLANKEIAARLAVRTSTVKEHVHRILSKTSLPSRAAIALAYTGGWAPEAPEAGSDGTLHRPER